jgi:hypothetical protein
VALPDKQSATLVAKRKQEPPDYYNAADAETYPISSSTEDALILLGSGTKQEARAYLNAYVNASAGAFTTDYNDLLAEFVEQQVANGQAVTAELQQITGKFNAFRSKLSGELNETNLIIEEGMQPILEAMTRTLGRVAEIDRSEYFHAQFNDVMEAQFTQEVTDGLKKELRSWIRVIASYP